MKKFLMFVVSVAALAPTLAVADEAVADRLHCGAAEMQVCTTPASDGSGFLVLTDSRARARTDCDVSQPRGVDLRCVAESDVRTAEQAACAQLGEPWRWSMRHERCYQHVERHDDGGSGNGNAGSGGNINIGQGLAVAVPRCTDVDRARLAAELDRIWNDRLVVEEFAPLQQRATEIYGTLVACDDGSAESRRLIDLAANMVASLEPGSPAYPDYTEDFEGIRELIAGIDVNPIVVQPSDEEENWCTDTVAGVFTCIILPVVVIGTGIGVGGALLYDHYDDDSANGVRTYY
jgi:hypothetical protein